MDLLAKPFALLAVLVAAALCQTISSAPVDAEAASGREAAEPRAVSALGRIEPEHGVITLSAPSVPDAVSGALVGRLLVEVGQQIEAGELLAVTDAAPVLEVKVAEVDAAITVAERNLEAARSSAEAVCVRAGVFRRDAERLVRLHSQKLASEDEIDRARGNAEAGAADCTAANAAISVASSQVDLDKTRARRARLEQERAFVRAPASGKVLAIHTRPGEQIGAAGILDMGQVGRMYAIAEVYETDIRNLRIGQLAQVSSAALAAPLSGRIERIRPLVRKMDEIGTDPAARKDARIIEVEVLLDAPEPVADRSYLQVEIVFQP